MTTRLAARLADLPTAKPRLRDHANILALRDEIQEALDLGYSRRAIWQQLLDEKRLTVKYHAFLHYLRRLRVYGPRRTPEEMPSHDRPAPGGGFRIGRRPNTRI
jgi:hypothetical protein